LYLESFELNVIWRLPRLDGLAVFVVGLLADSLQAKVGGTTSPADKASPTYRIERILEEEETERERKDSPESMSLLGLQSWWLGESERAESRTCVESVLLFFPSFHKPNTVPWTLLRGYWHGQKTWMVVGRGGPAE
jgi:hypothetical protein